MRKNLMAIIVESLNTIGNGLDFQSSVENIVYLKEFNGVQYKYEKIVPSIRIFNEIIDENEEYQTLVIDLPIDLDITKDNQILEYQYKYFKNVYIDDLDIYRIINIIGVVFDCKINILENGKIVKTNIGKGGLKVMETRVKELLGKEFLTWEELEELEAMENIVVENCGMSGQYHNKHWYSIHVDDMEYDVYI